MASQAKQARGHRGQGLLEYALIMVFVVLVVFGGLLLLGPAVGSAFNIVHQAL